MLFSELIYSIMHKQCAHHFLAKEAYINLVLI
jgi:hypothetical protein